jgi:Tol biopolymer transport system component
MWKHALFLLVWCCLLPRIALANGYDAYACPLTWSPDSTQLAAIVSQEWPYGSGAATGELRLYDHTGHHEVLLEGALASPCFSPDGAWLTIVLNGDLVAYDLTDGETVWLTVRGDVLDCCWAPVVDPALPPRIIFSAGERFYGSEIYSMPFTPGAELTPALATNTGPAISCFGPAPSPGGTHFLFLHQYGFDGPGAADTAVYERLYWLADGAQPEQQLTLAQYREEDYHESNVVWLAEDIVLFQRGGWGDWRLIRKDLTTGAEVILFTDAQQPSLSGDGQWLAFTRRDYRAKEAAEYDWEVPSSVWYAKLGYRRLEQLSGRNVQAAHPAVSPDGTRVAWLESDGQGVDAQFARLPGK